MFYNNDYKTIFKVKYTVSSLDVSYFGPLKKGIKSIYDEKLIVNLINRPSQEFDFVKIYWKASSEATIPIRLSFAIFPFNPQNILSKSEDV